MAALKWLYILKQGRPNRDRLYIMDMTWLHKNQYRKVFASFLVLFFFGSQAFSCCLVNRQMSDYLKAGLASFMPDAMGTPSHSCCPSKQAPVASHSSHGTSESSGCCIQDANSKLPQVASEGVIQPSFNPMVIERLPLVDAGQPPTMFKAAPKIALSGPPLYLTHLQLLI